MAHIANIKLGKYQVRRVYLNNRIIWEILPVLSQEQSTFYEMSLGQIPVAISQGWSDICMITPGSSPLSLKPLIYKGNSKIEHKSYYTDLQVTLDASSLEGEHEIQNNTTALSAFYNILLGAGKNESIITTESLAKIGFVLSTTSATDSSIHQSGSGKKVIVDPKTAKKKISIISNGLMAYSSKEKMNGSCAVQNYVILTNKIPSAPNTMQLRNYSMSRAYALGNISKEKTMFSNQNPLYSVQAGYSRKIECFFTCGATSTKDFSTALAKFTTYLPMANKTVSSSDTSGTSSYGYHIYMKTNDEFLNSSYNAIMYNNNNTIMYVTHATSIKNSGTSNVLNVTMPIAQEITHPVNISNTKPFIWYPALGYPRYRDEVTIEAMGNRVPLTSIDNAALTKNRTSILIRQAFDVVEHDDKVLEVI